MDHTTAHIEAAKLGLRDQIVTARGRLPLAVLSSRARQLAEVVLAVPEVRRAATVAAYVSVGREPGTGPLLDGLTALGKRIVLPLLLPDDDLDWAAYDGPESLATARRGLLEPVGRPLGVASVATADVVLVPGLAVDHTGLRLGRGGGSYDRALGRVPVGTFTCCLLNSEELIGPHHGSRSSSSIPAAAIPAAAHDRRVTAAATELSLHRFPSPTRR
ncbi:MAG: 5-formyltetrahydrofolate cyclo-ligase [Actinomycetota bacterium]|nr:5-formyltetrahydrofolate cyclo-ligase [Actinomycetota bacterium]